MKFLFTIFSFFIAFPVAVQAQTSNIPLPTGTGLPDPGSGVEGILINFASWLLGIFLVMAVLAFIITGFMYLFSMGDARSQNLENAKQYFKYAIIAVATVGASYILISSIDLFLNASL
jgi:hypothetical protein